MWQLAWRAGKLYFAILFWPQSLPPALCCRPMCAHYDANSLGQKFPLALT